MMNDDERCAGRFWWRARMRAPIFGQIPVLWLSGGTSASIESVLENGVGWRFADTDISEEMYLACLACKAYHDLHPGMSARELLGLPRWPVPEPAKPMTKAEIIESIRSVRRDWGRIPTGADERLAAVTRAVEAMPEPEVGKVSAFAELVDAVVAKGRMDWRRDNTRSPPAALRWLVSEQSCVVDSLCNLISEERPTPLAMSDTCDNLVDLAAACQRAAEDLGLVAKE